MRVSSALAIWAALVVFDSEGNVEAVGDASGAVVIGVDKGVEVAGEVSVVVVVVVEEDVEVAGEVSVFVVLVAEGEVVAVGEFSGVEVVEVSLQPAKTPAEPRASRKTRINSLM